MRASGVASGAESARRRTRPVAIDTAALPRASVTLTASAVPVAGFMPRKVGWALMAAASSGAAGRDGQEARMVAADADGAEEAQQHTDEITGLADRGADRLLLHDHLVHVVPAELQGRVTNELRHDEDEKCLDHEADEE